MPRKNGSKQGEVLGFRVSDELMQRLDDLATLDRRSRSQMARILIEEAVQAAEARKDQMLGSEKRLAAR